MMMESPSSSRNYISLEEEEEQQHLPVFSHLPEKTNKYILDMEDAFQKPPRHPYTLIHQLSQQLLPSTTSAGESVFNRKSSIRPKATLDDGFRAILQAVASESANRHQEAVDLFAEAGEILSVSAVQEQSCHIQDLLVHKSQEVQRWAQALADWLDKSSTLPLPKRIAQTVVFHKDAAEATGELIRYTPVMTKNPSNFTTDGYQLQTQSQPSLLIVITMYNEDADELASTLRKCGNNIHYLTEKNLPGYEGQDAWRNVLICIVSDGRKKANKTTLQYLHSIGLFDESAMNIASTGVDVQMHLFERVVHLQKIQKNKQQMTFPPLQLVFALKEHNSGKLNSHLWYFNAFCAQINPEYTGLLDVGTMPTKSAFYRLLWNMEINPQIGGVCGEIAVDKPIPNLCNFVIAAQHYEYKVSNLLDKAMESCFGYISVLPGAFSAYRYAAIKGAPLDAYFKSLTTPMAELGPFQGNMYLAEDRILAFEVLAKKDCNWTMNYVKDAIARTDVPMDLTSLIAQRRRWLNGSFFAVLFGIIMWYRVYTQSGHSWIRKFFFTIQYSFMVIQTVLSWFLSGAFFLSIYYVVIAGFAENQWGFVDLSKVSKGYKDLLSFAFCSSYGVVIFIQLIYGMGNKPKHLRKTYAFSAIVLGIIMGLTFIIAVLIFAYTENYSDFEIFFAVAILGIYFIAAAIHCELQHICLAFFQYLIMLPTFVNILMVYSFCNLHDLSWGTKGIDEGGHGDSSSTANKEDKGTYEDVIARQKAKDERQKKEAEEADTLKRRFDSFRSNLLLFWILSNVSFVGGCIYAIKASDFLRVLFVVVGSFNIFRFCGSFAYLLYLGRQLVLFQCILKSGKLDKKLKDKQTPIPEMKGVGLSPNSKC